MNVFCVALDLPPQMQKLEGGFGGCSPRTIMPKYVVWDPFLLFLPIVCLECNCSPKVKPLRYHLMVK